jgi:hypothetical protein
VRSGRKPRGEPVVETVVSPTGPRPVEGEGHPATQLSLETLDEPAEILVRFSTDHPDVDSDEAVAVEGAPTSEAATATTEAAAADATTTAETAAAETAAAETAAAETAAEPEAFEPSPVAPQYRPDPRVPNEDPALQIRLARIHLRTGSLAMARAQLESLAGRDLLDAPGTLDLAEARWRTGDLRGAGEAAAAYLAANGGEALGFIIAAEAATLAGRNTDARRDMEQALLRTLTSLDSVYRGIERKSLFTSTAWTATPVPDKARPSMPEAPASAAKLVGAAETAPGRVAAAEPVANNQTEAEADAPQAAADSEPVASSAVSDVTTSAPPEPAFEAPRPAASAVVDPSRINAATEISAGTALLEAGDPLMAALHFGIALRMTGASAPAVLAAIGERHDLPLELVRGDALRVLGLESDAGAAYLSVATALSAARVATQASGGAAAEVSGAATAEPVAEPSVAEPPVMAPPAAESPAAEPPAAEPPAAEPPVAGTHVDSIPAMPVPTSEAAPAGRDETSTPAPEAPAASPEKPQSAVLPPITWSD